MVLAGGAFVRAPRSLLRIAGVMPLVVAAALGLVGATASTAMAQNASDCLENGGDAFCLSSKQGPWRYHIETFSGSLIAERAACRAKGGIPHGASASSFWCEGPSEPYTDAEVLDFAARIGEQYFTCGSDGVTSDTGWGTYATPWGYGDVCGDSSTTVQDCRHIGVSGRMSSGGTCEGASTTTAMMYATRKADKAACPYGYTAVSTTTGTVCMNYPCGDSCPEGTNAPTGQNKVREEIFGAPDDPFSVSMGWNSQGTYAAPESVGESLPRNAGWKSSAESSLYVPTAMPGVAAIVQTKSGEYRAYGMDGIAIHAWPEGKDRVEVYGSGWKRHLVDGSTETFDATGRLIRTDMPNGRFVDVAYDADGRVQSLTDFTGRQITFAYARGKLETVTLPDSSEVLLTYDERGRMESVNYPDGRQKLYVYDSARDVIEQVVDETGKVLASYGYNTSSSAYGRVTTVTMAPASNGGAGLAKRTYSRSGNRTTVTDELGNSYFVDHVVAGGLTKIAGRSEPCVGCGDVASIQYDSRGWPSSETFFDGTTTRYTYDDLGRETERVEGAATPTGPGVRIVKTDWDGLSHRWTMQRVFDATAALVAKTTRTYNTRGQIKSQSIVDPVTGQASTTTYAYCEATDVANGGSCPFLGLPKSINGPLADLDTITFKYRSADSLGGCGGWTGDCHRKGDLYQIFDGYNRDTMFRMYDLAGRPTIIQDPRGVATRFTYDGSGRLLTKNERGATAAEDAITTFAYDPSGTMSRITDPAGAFVEFDYDALDRLTVVRDAYGNSITYELDPVGNRRKETINDAAGTLKFQLSRTYNQLGQLESIQDALNFTTGFTYDTAGRLDVATDALGRRSKSEYDALGRLRTRIENMDGLATDRASMDVDYDVLGRIAAVTDPNGLLTRYTYDGFGNRTRLESPDTGTTTYTFDLAGNPSSKTDARGVQTLYTHDRLSRLTMIDVPAAGQDITYTYDTLPSVCLTGETYSLGRLSSVTSAGATTTFCYDRRGNLLRKVQAATGASATRTVTYGYDLADGLTTMTYPSGASVTYARDAAGRITGVTAKPTATAATVTLLSDVDYLPFGPIGAMTFGNGRVLSKTYDQNYGIDAIADSAVNGLSIDYGLDGVGNVVALDERVATGTTAARTVTYDGLDRLTALKNGTTNVQSFEYDATGNRTKKNSQVYTYESDSHRLAANGTTGRTYDDAGNTLTIGTKGFTYDDSGRMVEFINNGTLSRTYSYDGAGQRVAKKVPASPGSDTYFVYDEMGHLIGEYRTGGTRIREFVWLDDTPIAVLDDYQGSSHQYILADHLNSPRAVVLPSTDAIIWRWDITATAFGDNGVQQNPDGDANTYLLPLRYPGQYYDSETGTSYNRFRDYEPATGRYIQSDPIGLAAGPSTYSYVGGNPTGNVDPLGLLNMDAQYGCNGMACGYRYRFEFTTSWAELGADRGAQDLADLAASALPDKLDTYPELLADAMKLLDYLKGRSVGMSDVPSSAIKGLDLCISIDEELSAEFDRLFPGKEGEFMSEADAIKALRAMHDFLSRRERNCTSPGCREGYQRAINFYEFGTMRSRAQMTMDPLSMARARQQGVIK